jgi:hypothetical protein
MEQSLVLNTNRLSLVNINRRVSVLNTNQDETSMEQSLVLNTNRLRLVNINLMEGSFVLNTNQDELA